MAYTVQKLATLSGVSIRTLHHYDEVGLLKPAYHGANGYRYYEEEQLLLLQQILFFRNLGFELRKIREVIKKSDFDKLAALYAHRKMLVNNLDKTRELIQTIDNTIEHLKGRKKMKENQFFEGFNSPKQKEWEKYLIETGTNSAVEIEEGRKRLEKWTTEDWKETRAEWEKLLNGYVSAIKKDATPRSPEAKDLVRRHLQYLKKFGIETKKEELVEKARSYLSHPDWRKLFDTYHPRLLDFMLAAFEVYAQEM
jgi:MerR family transcriptional regulator, thiopeptide resistance regulator